LLSHSRKNLSVLSFASADVPGSPQVTKSRFSALRAQRTEPHKHVVGPSSMHSNWARPATNSGERFYHEHDARPARLRKRPVQSSPCLRARSWRQPPFRAQDRARRRAQAHTSCIWPCDQALPAGAMMARPAREHWWWLLHAPKVTRGVRHACEGRAAISDATIWGRRARMPCAHARVPLPVRMCSVHLRGNSVMRVM
jgi:hypothetical protein